MSRFLVHFFGVHCTTRTWNLLFAVLWRTWTGDDEFSFLFFSFLNLNKILKNSTLGKVACIWHIERVQINAIKLERTQIHFFTDVFTVVVVVVLMSALKKLMKEVWAFKWCRVWITANNLKFVTGTRYICLGLFIIMDLFWRNKYFKAPGRNASIFSSRERTCGNKRRKMPYYNLLEDGAWAYYVSRLRSSEIFSSLYLRFAFRVCIFCFLLY